MPPRAPPRMPRPPGNPLRIEPPNGRGGGGPFRPRWIGGRVIGGIEGVLLLGAEGAPGPEGPEGTAGPVGTIGAEGREGWLG